MSHLRRREFMGLLGGAAAWPLAARAQHSALPLVGFASGRSLTSDAHLVAAFRKALNDSGFVEGHNLTIEFRWAEGALNLLPRLTADLVQRRVTVIFAGAADVHVGALQVAAATIPVVLATGGDPVALGLVDSLNRPEGNLTGVTVISSALWPKRLELLSGLINRPSVIGVMVNPTNPSAFPATRELEAAARDFGQTIIVLNTRTANDFSGAFTTLLRARASGLVVADDALFQNSRETLVSLAARHGVPAIYGRREYAEAGGLISYGASTTDQYRQSGIYVGRILKGSKPADLPFLQPTKFEMVINLNAAKALGLEVPSTLLATAHEVIE